MIEYWKERLGAHEQNVYQIIRDNISSNRLDMELPVISSQEFGEIMQAIELDHPEFYFLNPQYALSLSNVGGFFGVKNKVLLKINTLYSNLQRNQIDSVFRDTISTIKNKTHDGIEEIEKNICKYLVQNTTYSINNILNQNAASALFFKKAQCSGVAKAVKLLMDNLGLWSIIVAGKATNGDGSGYMPHAWNIVQLNGNYYHLDVTNMLIVQNAESQLPYFNYSDAVMSSTHTWSKESVPKCSDTKYDLASKHFIFGNVGHSNRGNAEQESVAEIWSGKELMDLLVKSSDYNVEFRYVSQLERNEQQARIMDIVKMFCRKNSISGSIQLSYNNGIWAVQITKK